MFFPIFLFFFSYLAILGSAYSLIWFLMTVESNVLVLILFTFGFFFIKGKLELYSKQYNHEITKKDIAEKFNALIKEMIEQE